MPSSAPVAPKKSKIPHPADYVRELRARRKEQGFVQVHWYIHESAYQAIVEAAGRDKRKVQQYVLLNVWKMVPEDLRPKDILEEPILIPKKKKVRLNLKIRRTETS
jgi:hypothetical protein